MFLCYSYTCACMHALLPAPWRSSSLQGQEAKDALHPVTRSHVTRSHVTGSDIINMSGGQWSRSVGLSGCHGDGV